MSKEIQNYKKNELGISYDPNICTHSANCMNGFPEIFNIEKEPWVNLDSAKKEKLTEAVKNCPSGALKIIDDTAQAVEEAGEIVKIDVMSKGPLLVKGRFKITDHNGNVLETKDKVALCRCGSSKNKPFCDGTHSKIDFDH
ncbi:MAG: (4Fe-4S)-binding protein [Bacteroidetes bacterium]|nr:(4Fe-4S)-binding protein [Bacteroidota bacterium]MCH8170226.1 (4Fe-4S)-binding protein [Bacteroidota bacterium]MCH8941148.1 (4Fe-4S)-binding protein [Bacteroidota bacterium]